MQRLDRPPEWTETEDVEHVQVRPSSEVSGLAVTSLVLGILGFACLPGVAGIAAIGFGIAARRDVEQSDGRRSGLGLANAGIAMGGTSIALAVVALGVVIAMATRPHARARHPSPGPRVATTAATPRTSTRSSPPPLPPASEFYGGVRTARIGRIVLVDLGPEVPSLGDELNVQRARAEKEGRKLLLWADQRNCQPCNGVAVSLRDPLVQEALGGVRVVRVDLENYHTDLQRRGIPTQFAPGFALLDTDNRPVDYLHGGEWDEDVAGNIAPVLGRFVRGTQIQRRHPWHTLPDANATPI